MVSPFILHLLTLSLMGLFTLSSRPYAQEIPDQVQITVLEEKVVAVSSGRGGAIIQRLMPGEKVLQSGAEGLMGFALTNRRILGLSARTRIWVIRNLKPGEGALKGVDAGDQVVLVVTNLGAYALSPAALDWAIASFMAGEGLVNSKVGNNIGLVATIRRVLGFSVSLGRWSFQNLLAGEKVTEVAVSDVTATVRTNYNLVIFNSATGEFERIK